MSVELSDDLAANYRGIVRDRGITFGDLANEMRQFPGSPGHHQVAVWAQSQHDAAEQRAAAAAVGAQRSAEDRVAAAAAARAATPEQAPQQPTKRGRRTADPAPAERRD